MKALLIVAFLSITFLPTEKWLTITDERIELIFNSEMKSDDLDLIQKKLAEKNITIDFTKEEYDKEGYLMKVTFEVDCNDGFSGSASSRWLTKRSNLGFYRDYRSEAIKVFGTGRIKG